MAGYNMTIKNSEETIEFSTKDMDDKPDITGIQFKMNTLDDLVRNKADSVRNEFVINGNITGTNRDYTKKLAKWAMDTDKKTLYREVEIVVYDSQNCSGEVLRRFEASNMFVIDYEEIFSNAENDSDSGTYKLSIAQKEGNSRREVFSS